MIDTSLVLFCTKLELPFRINGLLEKLDIHYKKRNKTKEKKKYLANSNLLETEGRIKSNTNDFYEDIYLLT